MSYYKELKMLYKELEKVLLKVEAERGDLKIGLIVLDLTKRYEVSESAIRKRIKLICSYSKNLDCDSDSVFYVEDKQ